MRYKNSSKPMIEIRIANKVSHTYVLVVRFVPKLLQKINSRMIKNKKVINKTTFSA